jgi:hypothetical protein
MTHKPNKVKMAKVISDAVPDFLIKSWKSFDDSARDAFYKALLKRDWSAFGVLLDSLKDSQFTWEIETGVDGFTTAVLFSPPDDDNFLHEVVRDTTYGEVAARLSCITAAIVTGHLW